MVSAVFKLLVGVVITVAILYVFFTQFMTYYLPEEDMVKELKESLSNSEVAEGTLVEKEFWLDKGVALSSQGFDTEIRSVAFACNDSDLCCFEEECGKKIVWDEISFRTMDPLKLRINTRCYFEEIFICKIFFGEKPAQVEIIGIEFNEEIDLGEGNGFDVNVIVRNEGEHPIAELRAELDLKKKKTAFEKEDIEKKELEGTVLEVGEAKKINGKIEILNNGEYDLYIKVFEEQDLTNFDKNMVSFNVIGGEAPLSGCTATKEELSYDLEEEQCVEEYYCEGCTFAFECAEEWREKDGKELVAVNKNHAKLLVDESACMLESDAELEYKAGFTIDGSMITPITAIDSTGFAWSVPIDVDKMQIRRGRPKWDPFNHPYDVTRYNPGMYPHRYLSAHRGVDIFAQGKSTPVKVIGDGVVFRVTGFGSYVLHTLPNGEQVTSIYGHSDGIYSLEGQQVTRGQVIAMLNCPSARPAPALHSCHIHLEMYKGYIWAAASSSQIAKFREGTGGAQYLPNDQYLINPIDVIGTYGR